jgi:uncharacterized protein involved in tolerance to divalent cations
MNSDVLMVLTNLPSRESAEKLASELVARRLAACWRRAARSTDGRTRFNAATSIRC